MPERLLKPGPAAWIASVAVAILVMVLAIIGLSLGAGVWLTFVYFILAAGALWIAWGVATGRTAWLQLDADGFTKKTPFSTHRFAWTDVSGFHAVEAWPRLGGFAKKVVVFRRTEQGSDDVFSAVTGWFDPSRGFAHNYDMEPDHFADLLNDYRQAALVSANLSQQPEKAEENSPQGPY